MNNRYFEQDAHDADEMPEIDSDRVYDEMFELMTKGKASDIIEVLINYSAGLYSDGELIELLDKELAALYERSEERLIAEHLDDYGEENI